MIKRNPNRYAGPCLRCGQTVPANGGYLTRDPATRKFAVKHWPQETVTPSGPWDRFEPFTRGGCPGDQTPWSASYTPPTRATEPAETDQTTARVAPTRIAPGMRIVAVDGYAPPDGTLPATVTRYVGTTTVMDYLEYVYELDNGRQLNIDPMRSKFVRIARATGPNQEAMAEMTPGERRVYMEGWKYQ